MTGSAKVFIATPNTQIPRTGYTTDIAIFEKKPQKDY
jgi:hypothetical protein